MTQTHRHTHPFLISSFSDSFCLPSSFPSLRAVSHLLCSCPQLPHLPFSPFLHAHGSLQQQLPDVLTSNPQHGGHQVQAGEWTQVLKDTERRGSGDWVGLVSASQPGWFFVPSPALSLSVPPLLGRRGSVSASPFYYFEFCPWNPHHWEGILGTPVWWPPASSLPSLCFIRLPGDFAFNEPRSLSHLLYLLAGWLQHLVGPNALGCGH